MTDITKRLAGALLKIDYILCYSADHAKTSLERKRAMMSAVTVSRAAMQAYDAQAGKASGWQPIETAPHEQYVLLFFPHRHESNPQRIEVGSATWGERIGQYSNRGSHSWATHWMPLPDPPEQST